MTDERQRAYSGPPVVTPEREEAWRLWKEDYVVACAKGWTRQGGTQEEVMRAATVAMADLMQVDDLPWMPLGIAVSHQVDVMLNPKGPVDKVQFINSLRTVKTSTERERTLSGSYQLGLDGDYADQLFADAARRDPEDKGTLETALYRHYDASDVLLYVGIAAKPSQRAKQHEAGSPWWQFVASSETEWFRTREGAEKAERDAIAEEHPVFNKTHNKANRDAALAYVFKALGPVSA